MCWQVNPAFQGGYALGYKQTLFYTALTFSRPLNHATYPINSEGYTAVVWACGPNFNRTFGPHDAAGVAYVNFRSGKAYRLPATASDIDSTTDAGTGSVGGAHGASQQGSHTTTGSDYYY